MSTAKENPCRKFQANFFNKSKCQNCFKPRELHLLTDQDLTQAKPIYGGWLCLAPEGTDFDNPMQRSRKWQRRFFVLYEHGCLRFALDESPSTLPQGTVNMNLCSDVIDAEPKTGQKNSLCIITPDQEYFIRGENKEIINGWSEQLIIYPRTNKQNQKKKRKVEPATSQEPGPAKVAVTGSGIPEAEKTPDSSSIIWQEELNQREAEGAAIWSTADLPPGSPLSAPGTVVFEQLCRKLTPGLIGHRIDGMMPCYVLVLESSFFCLLYCRCFSAVMFLSNNIKGMLWGGCPCVFYSRSGVIEKLEALELENQEKMEVEESGRETARQGRSEHRRFHREVRSVCVCTCVPLYNTCVKLKLFTLQWKKYWFVLTDHSLRYYKDSIAEEASDLDGEIDLSTCYSVTEHQAQRNYGFQIHVGAAVLSPSLSSYLKLGMSQYNFFTSDTDSPSTEASSVERESAPNVTKSRARERRREGRSKTFDWAEFRPIAQALAQQRAQEAECFQSDVGELDSSQRRDEQRKMYETVTSSEQSLDKGGRTECDGGESGGHTEPTGLVNAERQQMVEEVIEEHWRQVEKTPIRDERRVPLPTAVHTRETAELSQLLESYKHGELELQLRTALEREQDIRTGYISPATCERGFAAMEESHQKVIDELQRKHQRELENLQEEKERLLEEETAATISAIEAMKNAHRTELEKEVDRARKTNSGAENADVEEIHRQHEEELCSFQREIEVLSEQYSQKCLENAHLAQALEAERQALRQCQRENQELNAHNQELNNRLAAEITKMRSMTSEDGTGDAAITIQGKELYELEVMLRVKESEVQYLKQEINSLKDELQSAQRDKKYATDKYKDIYTELSIFKAKAERDLGRLREQLQLAHEALGEPSLEEMERGGYDIMKSKSNPDILRMAAAAAKRSERTMRSKSVSRDMPWDS
uniref:Myosin phosphatase Rho-interacting protein-like n=1 Tax=Gouania willdenowi TaxID=441366 RepID=A0A8C5EVH3_GOUWI